jgi:glycosyltransferase involved in cell wall biosynthesis
MNLILYCSALPASGGVSNSIVMIAKEAIRHGYKTRVVIGARVKNNYYIQELKKNRIPIFVEKAWFSILIKILIVIPIWFLVCIMLFPFMLIKKQRNIPVVFRKLYRELHYDIYDNSAYKNSLSQTLSIVEQYCKERNTVFHMHYLGSKQCHDMLKWVKANGIPLVFHYHANVSYSQITCFNTLFERPNEILGKKVIIIALSEFLRDKMAEKLGPSYKITAIPNWIEITNRECIMVQDNSPQIITLCTITRMVGGKGVEDLIRAVERFAEMGLPIAAIIIGGGIGLQYFVNMAERAGVKDQIRFTGEITEEEVDKELRKANIFTLTSSTEAMPLTLLNAMAHGIPVIMTSVGAVTEIVNNAQNGILVEIGNVNQLVQAIKKLAENPDLRLRMGMKGKVYFDNNFNVERVWPKLDTIYQEISALQT